jgi:hypothetical protein
MISLSSGDRKAISASSKASTASQSSASADEDGMRSGGRPEPAAAGPDVTADTAREAAARIADHCTRDEGAAIRNDAIVPQVMPAG